MQNIIKNIKAGSISDAYPRDNPKRKEGFDLARAIADEHQKDTGNKTIVTRVLDFTDQHNGRDREHFSFDIVELIGE